MKTWMSVSLRVSCVVMPFYFFLALISSAAFSAETWRNATAGGVVLGWSVFVAYRISVDFRIRPSGQYKAPFLMTMVQHAVVLCLAACVLDRGVTLCACLLAAILYWIPVGMIVSRRPSSPTSLDLDLVSGGFVVLAIGTTVATWLVQFARHPF